MKTTGNSALALALGLAFAGGAGATATSVNPGSRYIQECVDEWNDSEAHDYCTVSMSRIGASTSGQTGYCMVQSVSCSVTVNISSTATDEEGVETTTTTSTTISRANVPGGGSMPLNDVGDLVLCLDPNVSNERYDLRLRKSCETGETDADTAVQDGLPSLEMTADSLSGSGT